MNAPLDRENASPMSSTNSSRAYQIYQFSIIRKSRKLMTCFIFPQIYSLIYLIHLSKHSNNYVVIMLSDYKWKREFNNTMVWFKIYKRIGLALREEQSIPFGDHRLSWHKERTELQLIEQMRVLQLNMVEKAERSCTKAKKWRRKQKFGQNSELMTNGNLRTPDKITHTHTNTQIRQTLKLERKSPSSGGIKISKS